MLNQNNCNNSSKKS